MKLDTQEEKTLITFNVVSVNGDDEFSLVPDAALARIRELVTKESKWAFVDGAFVDVDQISENDLIDADHIMLTNAVGGGHAEQYRVVTRIADKVGHNIAIRLDAENHVLEIDVDQELVLPTSKYIEDITALVTQCLEEEAAEYVNAVGRKYGVGEPAYVDTGEYDPGFECTFSKDLNLKNDLEIDIAHQDNSIMIVANADRILEIVHERVIVTGALYRKMSEYVHNEIKRAKEVANIR